MKLFLQQMLMVFLVSFLFGNNVVQAQSSADEILGTWMVPEKDAKIKIYKEGNQYFGKIIWIAEPNNSDGTPRKDIHNVDASLRDQTIDGLVVMQNFKYDADDKEWIDGTLYNSRSGKTYSGYLKLQKNGSLFLKGYVMGMRWMGKSNVWTRVE